MVERKTWQHVMSTIRPHYNVKFIVYLCFRKKYNLYHRYLKLLFISTIYLSCYTKSLLTLLLPHILSCCIFYFIFGIWLLILKFTVPFIPVHINNKEHLINLSFLKQGNGHSNYHHLILKCLAWGHIDRFFHLAGSVIPNSSPSVTCPMLLPVRLRWGWETCNLVSQPKLRCS